jgi:flagellar biosynthetic protein FlhB
MAEEQSGQEKTEAPTQRRLSEAREKGDIARSVEVPSAAVLLAAVLTLYAGGPHMLAVCRAIMRHYLGAAAQIDLAAGTIRFIATDAVLRSLAVAGPLMAVIVVVAVLANLLQNGPVFSTEKIAPDPTRIDPVQGFANLFSKQMLAQTVKSILKVLLVGLVAWMEVEKRLPRPLPLMDQEPMPILVFMARTAFWIFLKCCLVIAALAAADYAFQRWQFMEKMKMTKQELKDEARQTEGDPHVKGRIRSLQMEMARRRMMDEVPKADVVITNPTHLAVALRYEAASMAAPRVVAKGAGLIAARIREIAEENGVPVVEDKPLARALFREVELDGFIPENLFQAVAEVLAYVYSLSGKGVA